ncbi:5-(carboxyamino)imidazole ribonucleotide synthase [Alkaliphilus pronyensis]|uniref:N5-carboxyaminoimidazole ribonucleotide synthase n=1 Tax=Alkaliphilus pronyensis TaxID=1482732 RepID=A0A6I0FAQ6_9FIRM|nr:5-(carboxyamino)imidazole ribonucleotide synthase [Alkaliphilus pronyensis]KAB3534432.1 5-(carboxyamino)imidazole ribonucleotide synthase [Alkaliphilus pronyensis]
MKLLHTLNNTKIGIIGGGQLGKMMAIEGKKLGLRFIILDPQPDCPASSVVDEQIVGDFFDDEKIKALADKTDIITYEFEHIYADLLIHLIEEGYRVYPSPEALKIIQDKYHQKEFLTKKGIEAPEFREIKGIEDIYRAIDDMGLPLLLKSRRGGYDGKGNYLIKTEDEVQTAYEMLGGDEKLLMVEAFVDFRMEISAIVARGAGGEQKIYPLSENIHENNILKTTIAPARVSDEIAQKAKSVAEEVVEVLDGVGVFCIEMFVDKNEKVLINEIAPRVHNSGHYTFEGCYTSQFEQHLRAILGLPLGSTELIKPSVMINLLGEDNYTGNAKIIGAEKLLEIPAAYLHFYGKNISKPQRKMGHITVLDSDIEKAMEKAEKARGLVRVIGEEAIIND